MSGGLLESLKDAVGWPRAVPSHEPLARALGDHARSGRSRSLLVHRPGGVRYALSTEEFFELSGEQAPIDDAMLAVCRGRVLDLGAGAGRHALALQARGLEVVAVDVSPICVDVMRSRGVVDAREADVWSVVEEPLVGDNASVVEEPLERDDASAAEGALLAKDAPFDSVVFAMQSIGITGTIEGIERMLRALASDDSPANVSPDSPALARGVLARGGCVLLDSSPPIGPGFARRIELAGADPNRPAEADGWLAGEAVVSFDYRGLRGESFDWIYIGAEALTAIAAECGFDTEILVRLEDSPEYLARLTRSSERDENTTGAGV